MRSLPIAIDLQRLQDAKLSAAGTGFFSIGTNRLKNGGDAADWKDLRDGFPTTAITPRRFDLAYG